jgi:lysine 2,3-aminomutase
MSDGDPLLKQVLPDPRELVDPKGMNDPLAEDRDSPVQNITHRYTDRVLFLVSNQCAVYCRFCTRKRKIGYHWDVSKKVLVQGVSYIKEHREIRDVLLSGGDPFMLSNERLDWILSQIREIPHVDIIRIGTRIPSVLPQRITSSLVSLLKRFHPLFINVHFNHPLELTQEAQKACSLLVDAGIPLGNQTVLLKEINDDPNVLRDLFRQLLKLRIRPYYLHQCDLSCGTAHFRTSIEEGIGIMRSLRGRISGLGIPTYVIDLPGGGGKVPLTPKYIIRMSPEEAILRNYQGKRYVYPQTALQGMSVPELV